METVTPYLVLIDDEKDLLNQMTEVFSDANVEVSVQAFTDPLKALTFLTENDAVTAMVFCDYKMPQMNGLDLRQAMLDASLKCPFVLVSGHVTRDMLEKGMDLKVLKFVSKPCEDEQILEIFNTEGKERANLIEEEAFLKNVFTAEASELFEDLEGLILELESSPQHLDTLNSIFRLVHTIKGGSSVINWADFTKFCHFYEDLLSKLKRKEYLVNDDIISKLLKGADFLGALIREISNKKKDPVDLRYWEDFFRCDQKGVSDTSAKEEQSLAKEAASAQKEETIKVTTALLDEVMEQSGEITVIRNTINKLVKTLAILLQGNEEVKNLADMLEELHKVIAEMQSRILELRLVPVKNIYRSYPRTIRDLCASLEKKISLNLVGEELSVDTKLAQVLSNSLIHIVRNCCDHGIEKPSVRLENKKPEMGTITIESSETGEDVIIVIKDDGGGIDPKRIGKIAVEKGLYAPDEIAKMSEKRVLSIIFEPGFSTAEKITDVSGRGVGMDMVKSSVTQVGGKIDLSSQLGQGSTFTFKLPIPRSVLIINSLSVGASDRVFSIPQDTIERIIQYDENKRKRIKELEGTDVLDLDGELIQIVPLSYSLGLSSDKRIHSYLKKDKKEQNVCFVVTRSEMGLFALYVDEILDNEEIVVKNLAKEIGSLGVYLGATFMGDGRIGLILDMDGIARKAHINAQIDDNDIEEENLLGESRQLRDSFDYLILEIDDGHESLYCIPLKDVFRLEEFARRKINVIDGVQTVIYRDQVIPFVELDKITGESKKNKVASIEAIMAVIVFNNGRYTALGVQRIRELSSSDTPIDSSMQSEPWFHGTCVLNGKVYSVINTGYFVERYQAEIVEEKIEEKVAVEGNLALKPTQPEAPKEVDKDVEKEGEVEGLHLF